jgi:hypothetical protein
LRKLQEEGNSGRWNGQDVGAKMDEVNHSFKLNKGDGSFMVAGGGSNRDVSALGAKKLRQDKF